MPISSLLPHHRCLYSNYESFNPMQSKVFNSVYNSDENVVISGNICHGLSTLSQLMRNGVLAPTASGKTTLLELAILRFFKDGPQRPQKAVYIAPLKYASFAMHESVE
jgi:ATP-dependent DNA helicase HFM1/MER3